MKIKANGIQVNYELSGKEGAPQVVLSHSLGCNLHMWDPQMKALDAHFRVLRFDTRGHGGSDAPEGAYTMEQLGEDAIGLLDALGIDRCHWVGLSMGGMIGQCLALNHAHRLQSLALCDTGPIVPEEAQPIWQERIDSAREKGLDVHLKPTMQRWFTSGYLSQNPPGVALITKQFLATPVAGYIGCIEAIRRLNYLDRLPEIKKPTLIIVGEDDQGTPVTAAEAMRERIAGSKMVVLPSSAHLSNVEQPEAFTNALLGFLLEH
jgi:3-oxoadipate enol-lactonase